MKPIVVIATVTALALSGCEGSVPSRTRTLARCEIDAIHLYPGQQPEESDAIHSYVAICAEAAGLQWDLHGPACNDRAVIKFAWRNPWCYRPTNDRDGG